MAEPARVEGATAKNGAVTSRFLTDREEIGRVFKTLRDQRANLEVRFQHESVTYTVKVLDLQGDTLLLEDVQPRDGLSHFRSGKPFALSGRAEGIYIHAADNHAHKSDSERGIPFFHVRLPGSMLYQQRRRAARFRLPLRVVANGARVLLYRAGADAALMGEIIDISAGGCRAELPAPIEPALAVDEMMDSCAVSIPNLLELNARSAIRHATLDRQRQVVTCGIEFMEMHVTDRRRLEQFIQSIARLTKTA
ncbi:MAG: PilZ domain-containing protein [Pseudomonadales bacterium]